MAGPQRTRVLNSILNDAVVKPVCHIFKKVFGEGSNNDRFSVDENLLIAPGPPMKPMDIPKIPEEDQLLMDDEAQGQRHEADEVQSQLPEADEIQDQLPEVDEVQGELPEADEVQDLEDLISELFQDADMKDAVIFKSTKLSYKGGGHWVAEPHVRVWNNKPCSIF